MLRQMNNSGIRVRLIILRLIFLVDTTAHVRDITHSSFVHQSHKSISQGGDALYISHELNHKPRSDLCINIECEFECIIG